MFISECLVVVFCHWENWAIVGWYIQWSSLSIKFSVLLVLKAVITFIVSSKTKHMFYFSCTSALIMIGHQLFSTNPKLWHYKSLPPYWSLAFACKNKVKVQLATQRNMGGQSFVHRHLHSKTYNPQWALFNTTDAFLPDKPKYWVTNEQEFKTPRPWMKQAIVKIGSY